MRKRLIYNLAKRLFDIFVAGIAVIITLPFMVIAAAAIRFTSPGPVIFRQQRAGKDAKPFTLCKFRTMTPGTDPFGPSPKSNSDLRLTKTGIFLREWSLDELPQLFNVLKGDMSIVGPRPLYMEQIAEWNQRQKKRLLVKPGLTGLAQVSGRAGLTIEEKLELDVRYVENTGFLCDLKIILSTPRMLLKKENIYEKKYSQSRHTRGR